MADGNGGSLPNGGAVDPGAGDAGSGDPGRADTGARDPGSTAADPDSDPGAASPEPGQGPGPARRALAWVRGHGPQTLLGSLFVTVAGTVVSVLLTSVVGGSTQGDTSAKASAVHSAGDAASTPSCSGEGCDGLDPKAAGCADDARTLAKDWAGPMQLEIRYSVGCHTVWAKLTGAAVRDTVEIRTSPTRRQIASVRTGTTKYTPMLPVTISQDFTAQATAVAVNSEKRAVAQGHVLTVAADAGNLPPGTPAPTASAN